MADIQHWRRMIQSGRVRTPFEPDDSPESVQPTPHKPRLKRKVSSYFDFAASVKHAVPAEDHNVSQLPEWPSDQPYPDPKAEDEMDSIFCRLMANPHAQLDIQCNGSLLRIFESYIKLQEEKDLLYARLNREMTTTGALISKFNMSEKDWEDEKQDYKEEVKRLEILLAKSSKRGLAEVTLARQDSKLRSRKAERRDDKETVFEFLEKTTRRNDSTYNSQRATMKPLLQSPDDKDKRMSRALAQQKSMTNIHSELPFGTPPDRDMRFSLTNMSLLDQKVKQKLRARAATDTSTASTFSSFSCEANPCVQSVIASAGCDAADSDKEDLMEMQRLAHTLARRRNVEPRYVMPQLLDLFRGTTSDQTSKANLVQRYATATMPQKLSTVTTVPSAAKRHTVMSRASGLFHRLKSQPSFDLLQNVRGDTRRFSFEPGDDGIAQSVPDESMFPGDSEERRLRKSASLGVLQDNTIKTTVVEAPLSPVAASPTSPEPFGQGRSSTRIPTPVFSPGMVAKPRAEREDSSSSLLTAVKHNENAAKGSNSVASSSYSSPSTSLVDISGPRQLDLGTTPFGKSSSSNRLLDHTNALRNVASTYVASGGAARSSSVSSDIDSDLVQNRKQPGTRSHLSHSTMGVPQQQDLATT